MDTSQCWDWLDNHAALPLPRSSHIGPWNPLPIADSPKRHNKAARQSRPSGISLSPPSVRRKLLRSGEKKLRANRMSQSLCQSSTGTEQYIQTSVHREVNANLCNVTDPNRSECGQYFAVTTKASHCFVNTTVWRGLPVISRDALDMSTLAFHFVNYCSFWLIRSIPCSKSSIKLKKPASRPEPCDRMYCVCWWSLQILLKRGNLDIRHEHQDIRKTNWTSCLQVGFYLLCKPCCCIGPTAWFGREMYRALMYSTHVSTIRLGQNSGKYNEYFIPRQVRRDATIERLELGPLESRAIGSSWVWYDRVGWATVPEGAVAPP